MDIPKLFGLMENPLKKENNMIYDMTLKFESEIFVNRFDKDFETILSNLGGPVSKFGQTVKLEHTVSISKSPVLPNDKFIDVLKQNIFEALNETFEKQDSLNVEVKGVEFVGIIKIRETEQ